METGKLSPSDLERIIFPFLGTRRPDVLVRAAVGEDSAIIDFGDWVCVLSTDPITGATRNAGWLAVHVSCNDVASNGAEPVGVLVTLLLSEQADEEQLRGVMEEVHRAASELGIEVLGGHTEVTPGLPSTIISSTAVGKAPKSRYVVSSGAQPGDALVLTKSAGLEGTAILATDFEDRLRGALAAEQLARAQAFRQEISVVPEGLAAAELGATAMHDATEGGVLGAIHEMVTSAGLGVEVWADAVPVREETRDLCRFFHADPLKLISSGALLIACPDGPGMVAGLSRRGVPASVVGRVTDLDSGRWVVGGDRRRPLEPSYRDELWRILESGRGSA
ncbi:MAG: AIR synthase family protein [Chloroflexota bacterium]